MFNILNTQLSFTKEYLLNTHYFEIAEIDVNMGYITDTTKIPTPIPITLSRIGSNKRSRLEIYHANIAS